ncbi:MAG: hypothetical protein JKY45_08640 [Emcibacter sp.]|nr:hypothetical protein [Emcibacter sp.]
MESKVSGTYLGHTFTGKILKLQTMPTGSNRKYTILFDQAIDVVTSQHFSNFRRRINCILDQSLKSVDHKGRPDNLVQIT